MRLKFDSKLLLPGFFFAIILINRSFPYLLFGPFGFGYDTGIYKKTFEGLTSFGSVFHSQIDLFPSFLGYLFNVLSIPTSFLLYHFYILASACIAIPLYLLTKTYFEKKTAIVAIAIFSFSYIQIFASEFYLFKAMLGAIFMLLAFLFYEKKSYLFYLFALLLALTELPQFLLLAVGVLVATCFNFKKHLKFHLVGAIIAAVGALIILIFSPTHIYAAIDVVISSLKGIKRLDAHYTGLFLTPEAYLQKATILPFLGTIGLILCLIKKKSKTILVSSSLIFVTIVVVFKIFFQNRYVIEMDLLFIPFTAYFLVYFFEKFLKPKTLTMAGSAFLIIISLILTVQNYQKTRPVLNANEVKAVEFVKAQTDAQYVMVTDTFYGPWFYGFSEKITLAPGMLESVWNFETFNQYMTAPAEVKTKMLLDISKKYGTYYLFLGSTDKDQNFSKYSEKAQKVLDLPKAVVYKISA